jgi:regulator of sigma E protease
VVILLIEAVIRREISPKVRIIVQQIGMVLLLGLMVMVLFNDFITHIFTSCP